MSGRRAERGIALASVLWGVAALSLIAAAMLSSSMNAVRISRTAWTQLRVQTAADAAVQSAVLSLFDPGRSVPLDGTARQVFFDGIAVSVSIQDEAGRIDINYAGRGLLRDLFKSASAENPDALADRVVDWRSPKGTRSLNGATAADYSDAGYAYRPRGGPFQSVDELKLVMGMTPELFQRIEPALTVYSHRPDFNLLTAPEQVLLTIPGMDESKAEQAIATRDAPPAQPGAPLPGGAVTQPGEARAGQAYSIVATVEQDRTRFSRQAVILLTDDPAHPFWFLAWK